MMIRLQRVNGEMQPIYTLCNMDMATVIQS